MIEEKRFYEIWLVNALLSNLFIYTWIYIDSRDCWNVALCDTTIVVDKYTSKVYQQKPPSPASSFSSLHTASDASTICAKSTKYPSGEFSCEISAPNDFR